MSPVLHVLDSEDGLPTAISMEHAGNGGFFISKGHLVTVGA